MSYEKFASIPLSVCDQLLSIAKGLSDWKENKGPDVHYRTKQNVAQHFNVELVKDLLKYWNPLDWHDALLISIPSGGHIPLHTESCGVSRYDRGPWRKFHIPLQTTKQAVSKISGKDYCLSVGSIYEILFKEPHESFNDGPMDRIHLVMEIYE